MTCCELQPDEINFKKKKKKCCYYYENNLEYIKFINIEYIVSIKYLD